MALLFLMHAPESWTQQIGKPKETAPLERPKPLVLVRADSQQAVIGKLVSILKSQGFASSQVDWDNGEILASRSQQDGTDSVLLWLARPLTTPNTIAVYLLYGRYEEFLGEGLVRVKADASVQNQRIGTLKAKLIELALEGGQ
jgi:hypothetical protein